MFFSCGNQRDLARLKNAKKQQELKKSQGAAAKEGNAGVSTDKRLERDAEVMRQKQEKALEKKAAEAAAAAAAAATQKVVKVDPMKLKA
uniref:Small EDRK-rich factor-like N-terminal domain-containing protein n=1 Tax=Panagrolaimus sp. PS1159 TaxID=55785 RepID=A0AC35GGT6_9BILA